MIAPRQAGVLLVLTLLQFPLQASAAGTPFDIDVNELDRAPAAAPKKPAQPKKPKPQPKKPPKPIIYADGYGKYTVQESDYRTRILAKHLHITEDELQRLLPEILRLNGISSLSELEVGQTLIFPAPPKATPEAGGAPEGSAPAPGAPGIAPPSMNRQ